MDRVVPISEARTNLGNLIDEAGEHEVYIMRHGHPVAVLVSLTAYERAIEHIEDLEDTLATIRAQDEDSVPLGSVLHEQMV